MSISTCPQLHKIHGLSKIIVHSGTIRWEMNSAQPNAKPHKGNAPKYANQARCNSNPDSHILVSKSASRKEKYKCVRKTKRGKDKPGHPVLSYLKTCKSNRYQGLKQTSNLPRNATKVTTQIHNNLPTSRMRVQHPTTNCVRLILNKCVTMI